MQKLDDAKRTAILQTAARMFATRSYHEVRLDDVAAAAHIGKGTVYIYFKSKEDLYDSLILDVMSGVHDRLRDLAQTPDEPWAKLEGMIAAFVEWAVSNPHFFEMIRQASTDRVRPRLRRKRRELGNWFEQVLREGIEAGVIDDPAPELTAQFIPAFVRSAIRHGPGSLEPAALTAHILRVLGHGVRKGRQ